MERPDYLIKGDIARLIPVIADTRNEQRVVSVLLAVMAAVPEFSRAILGSLGHRLSQRSIVNTYTEVVFKGEKNAPKDQPDGLIVVNSGRRKWTALMEAKIGNGRLGQDQVERYLRLARANGIDAVVTISNEFATIPTHHPLSISKVLTRSVDLFHLSWKYVLTEAIILHSQGAIEDREKKYLLREFQRFLSSDSVGVTGFTTMPAEWDETVDIIRAGGRLTPRTPGLENIIASWHQETRDVALQMGRAVEQHVNVKLKRSHAQSQEQRVKDGVELLCHKHQMQEVLEVPDAASGITIIADVRARALRAGMTLDAPQDRKSGVARLRWLLRQLKDTDATGVTVRLLWPSRAADSVFPLEQLRDDESVINEGSSGAAPRAFEVALNCDSGRRFRGRKTFIEDLERLVPDFYERIGEHLKPWVPSPPKIKAKTEAAPARVAKAKPKPQANTQPEDGAAEEHSAPKPYIFQIGNQPDELLDIPPFLRRT